MKRILRILWIGITILIGLLMVMPTFPAQIGVFAPHLEPLLERDGFGMQGPPPEEDPVEETPPENNPPAYHGRMEGSGNIIFGDTVTTPL